MEMWKLPLMPMENTFTAYGKGRIFPTGLQTGFPQQRRIKQFTHSSTTPATTNIHPFFPEIQDEIRKIMW
jgi:hypothetical protein